MKHSVKKAMAVLFSLVAMASLLYNATAASADLFFYSQGGTGEPAGLHYIHGTGNEIISGIQNLNGSVDSVKGIDGKPRIVIEDQGSNALKMYNPYGGTGWATRPEADVNLSSKAVVGDFTDNGEFNCRGFATLKNYLYVAYFGNDIGFNSAIDKSTRIVQYDMSNGFKKVGQFIYEPEKKDPDAAANAMDIVAYNGKVYGVYVGLKDTHSGSTMWFEKYKASCGYVVEFDENLNVLRELEFPGGIAIYSGGMTGGSSNCFLWNNKLLVASQGGMMTDGYRDTTNISIIDLDNMTATMPVVGKNIPGWDTNIQSVTATPEGDVYFISANFPGWSSMYGYNDSDAQYVYKTTMDKLENGDIGTKIWESTWSGMFMGVLEIVYDESTKTVWWNPGEGGLVKYDGTNAPTLFKSNELGYVNTIFVTNRVKVQAQQDDIEAVAVEVPQSAIPASADAQAVVPVIDYYNEVSVAKKAQATGIASEDFAEIPTGISLKRDILSKAADPVLANGAEIVSPLPIFDLTLSPDKKLGVVAFKIEGKDLYASDPSKVNVIKITGDKTGLKFAYAAASVDCKDGCYAILNAEDDTDASVIENERYYKLVLYIGDNGKYDLNKEDHVITDPVVIVKENAKVAEDPEVDDPGISSSGGSGGCNAGFPLLLFFAVVPLAAWGKKRKFF